MKERGGIGIIKRNIADVAVTHALYTWLQMVAKHVNLGECADATVETLWTGLLMASSGCSKYETIHLNTNNFVQKDPITNKKLLTCASIVAKCNTKQFKSEKIANAFNAGGWLTVSNTSHPVAIHSEFA